MRLFAALTMSTLLLASCAPSSPAVTSPSRPRVNANANRDAFVAAETDALEWLSAGDWRLRDRFELLPSEGLLAKRDALEKTGDAIVPVGDPFGFRVREHAIGEALKVAAKLPRDPAPAARERDGLIRLLNEEKARITWESDITQSSAELLRGIVSTWSEPQTAREWAERDVLVAHHLDLIADAIAKDSGYAVPPDVDDELASLERLVGSMKYPKSVAKIANLFVLIGQDTKPRRPTLDRDHLVALLRNHLGVTTDPGILARDLEQAAAQWKARAREHGFAVGQVSEHAYPWFEKSRCDKRNDSLVRSFAPPPERSAICGAMRALAETTSPAAQASVEAILHDASILALWAITPGLKRPAGQALLFHPSYEEEGFARYSVGQPGIVLGLALSGALLLREPARIRERAAKWLELGELTLDQVANELGK